MAKLHHVDAEFIWNCVNLHKILRILTIFINLYKIFNHEVNFGIFCILSLSSLSCK